MECVWENGVRQNEVGRGGNYVRVCGGGGKGILGLDLSEVWEREVEESKRRARRKGGNYRVWKRDFVGERNVYLEFGEEDS